MKTRQGFVSNSSSSSFVIYSTKELDKEIVSRAISKNFKISKKHIMYPFIEAIADSLLEHSEKASSVEQYKKQHWIDDDTWVPEEIKKALDEGKVVYTGSIPNFGDGGNALESIICDIKFSYKDNVFTLEKDNRY